MTASGDPAGPSTPGAARSALRILLTGASHSLGSAAAAALRGASYEVDTTGTELTDPAAVNTLVDGASAIVHLAPLAIAGVPEAAQTGELLDEAARGTHVLMKAALDAGVRYVVQGSTLAIMDAYGDDLEVTEQWRPRPRPEPAQLAPYLAELVTREFTRDPALPHWLHAICLRFAPLDGPDALRPEDAGTAIVQALATLLGGESRAAARGHFWQVLHVAAPAPTARYSSHAAARTIGYGVAQ